MDGMESLRHAITTVPIPGAPPRLSHHGAAVGLALLDASLRLNHVRRLTERLTLVEHGAARRVTEVDISLRLLDEGQRDATAGLQGLIGKEHGERDGGSTLWVPMARLPRRAVSAVDVYGASGEKLPRLSQLETSRLIASGLYRLLRGILASDEHAQSPKQDLSGFLFRWHEPRWLVQRSLVTLLTERDHPAEPFTLPPSEGTVPGYGKQCRDMALKILDDYGHLLVEYAELLTVAVRDYLLVVGVDDTVDEHRLRYETPLHVNEIPQTRFPRLTEQWKRLRAGHRGYFAQYETSIPATLKSYHLVVGTAPEVDVARMFLSTDADHLQTENIAADLTSIAAKLDASPTEPSLRKLLELQVQTVLRTLAELMRRRRWEADQSGVTVAMDSMPACGRLVSAAVTGEGVRVQTNDVDNALLRHPAVTTENLRAAASEITDCQLGDDLVLVSRFPDNEAQAYWRRSGTGDVRGDQVRVKAGLVLKDSTESGPRNVMLYAIAVAVISYALGWLLVGSPWLYGREATQKLGHVSDGQSVITMLLLVPGFLYSRLAVTPRRSVASYLRTLPLVFGQLSIVAAAAFAATIATSSRGEVVQVFLTIAVVLPVLAALLLLRQRAWHESTIPLKRIGVPRWAGNGQERGDGLLPVNVCFDSTGGSR